MNPRHFEVPGMQMFLFRGHVEQTYTSFTLNTAWDQEQKIPKYTTNHQDPMEPFALVK